MAKKPKFTHLHVHSHYSLLDGLSKIDELLDKCEKDGMDSIALTDHGVMYGIVEFYQKAKKRGIKPILGVEAYVAPNGLKNKRSRADASNYHLTLLAKNEKGYKNLLKLTSLAHLDGFYYKPRIDYDTLEHYTDGLICLSGCLSGQIPKLIVSDKYEDAKKLAIRLRDMFRKDDFYLELQSHPKIHEQALANKGMIKLSKEIGVPVVATHDSHYIYPEDAAAQDILVAVQTGNKVTDTDRMSMKKYDFSLKSPDEMARAFKNNPEAIEATQEIANKCNIKIDLSSTHLPKFEVPDGETDLSYLKNLVNEGAKKRLKKKADSKEVTTRLKYELSVVEKTGYASYFLIVQDFVNWAKGNGIVVGPGRGSAAGSLVSYVLNITDVNPLDYDLMFERFLNPERVSMPDIDIDFTDVRRDEVIEYARQKYGRDRVAQIITFGTMASRMAIRDVGRALGISYSFCDQVAKMIPLGYSLEKSMNEVEELKALCKRDKDGKELIKYARKLEGVVRHASTHACGVVITENPLTDYTPLQMASNGDEKAIVTQYEMHAVEDLGLLKMDFLGLKNLTVIENTLKIVKATRGKKIDISKIPIDDDKAFKLLREGKTIGIFQLESGGMTRYLKQLAPTEMEDIIAMVALYRPGPMELIPSFIRRKHGLENPEYVHPKLEPVLKNTYGIIVYQEQIIRLAQELGGLSYAEADLLRKAVGKKIEDLLAKQEKKLIKGMINNRIDPRIAEQIWDFIKPFARYGFNRSHAACYAFIAYETAYLKSHFPAEFMAALMTAESSNIDRIAKLVDATRDMNLEVLPPDINESWENFTIVKPKEGVLPSKIRFGLSAIKNVGKNLIIAMIHERKKDGPYESINNFIERVNHKDLNKKSLESLTKAGVLDGLEERNTILGNLESLLRAAKESQKNEANGQSSLFAGQDIQTFNIKLKKFPKADEEEMLRWEKDLLGLYVSSHPLDPYREKLEKRTTPIDNIDESWAYNNELVKLGGIISFVKKIVTKKGDPMLFVQLEDLTGKIELVVFPKVFAGDPDIWEDGNIIIVSGRVDVRGDSPKLICQRPKILRK